MDELIASKIIESNIPTSKIEFLDVVELINKFSKSEYLRDWIRNQNNFIGFCLGAKSSAETLNATSLKNVEVAIANFEEAFSSINVSKVNLGKVRRELVSHFIQNFDKLWKLDEFELLDKISDRIL